MASNAATARIAGLLYLIVVATGIFSLAWVPSVIEASDDPATVVAAIREHETLFRLGIAAGYLCYTAFLILPLALYRLLAPYGRTAAALMVALAVASVPMSFGNLVHRIDILSLLGEEASLRGLSAADVNLQVMVALEHYWNGIFASKILWGLWLLPFGWLVVRSAAIPRVLGVLLMAGCFGYLIAFFGRLLVPGYSELPFIGYVSMPATLGEIGSCLWLLVMGAREREAVAH
ncbi:DUF4386 domain-containing protein [Sphingomonas sp. AOB5]|uniref:DUF4386 domain-containing protein n=1 Tax=Sphingomonas sp. AOB5 TaxID=3034017 RepID=UPI0023F6D58A|nr:DUF4386 domain-containing protein [Sphingomonas sp. AOB5]MDF7774944.1 DUF4386 domain-containing protein [Sphingomonas sp. AOB5]